MVPCTEDQLNTHRTGEPGIAAKCSAKLCEIAESAPRTGWILTFAQLNTPPAMMHDAEHTLEHRERPDFRPGFRLSVFDFVFLAVGAVAAYFAFTLRSLPAAIPAYVIFTFFLYCNVFRIRRTPELIWAGAFTALALSGFYLGQPSWGIVFMAGIVLTIILVAIEMRHASYHGIMWRSLNPELPTWWDRQHTQTP